MKKIFSVLLSIVVLFSIMATANINSFALLTMEEAKAIKLGQSVKVDYDASAFNGENYESYVAKFVAPESKYYEFKLDKLDDVYMKISTPSKYINSAYWYPDTSKTLPYVAGKLTKGTTYYLSISVGSPDPTSYSANLTVIEHKHNIKKNQVSKADSFYDFEFKTHPDRPYYQDGTVFDCCTRCNYYKQLSTIPCAKTVTLSRTRFAYDGKVKKPTVVVKDRKGKVIPKTEYTVKYIDEDWRVNPNRKSTGKANVGDASVVVKFKGSKYTGSFRLEYKVLPQPTSITKLVPSKKGIKVYWKEQAKQTTGYQIKYSLDSNMTDYKIVNIYYNDQIGKSINDLKGKKKYYVQIRTMRIVEGSKYFSKWSAKKSVVTK